MLLKAQKLEIKISMKTQVLMFVLFVLLNTNSTKIDWLELLSKLLS